MVHGQVRSNLVVHLVSSPKNSTRARQVPKQDRSRAAVAAIQEATLLVLLADGFGGLTTNAIAERAGVGIGSIYRYFTNKESIVASLTRNAGSELLANPRACELFGELDIESRIRFGFIGAIDIWRQWHVEGGSGC